MIDLQEREAIKRLKYRYFRCLDLKRWDELKACFVEDATSAYGGGERPTGGLLGGRWYFWYGSCAATAVIMAGSSCRLRQGRAS